MARCRLITTGAGARRWKQECFCFGASLACIQTLGKVKQMQASVQNVCHQKAESAGGRTLKIFDDCVRVNAECRHQSGPGRAPAQLRHKCPRY